MEEAKSRYMMVGVFTIPVARKSRELVPLVPGLGEILAKEKVAVEEGDLEGPLLPEVEEGGDDIPGHVDGDPGDMEKWEEMVEPEEVEVRNYTLVEVLLSRNGEAITLAMARMVARLNYLNLEVRRIHSDRAGELASKATSDGAPTEAFSAPIHRAGVRKVKWEWFAGVSRSC